MSSYLYFNYCINVHFLGSSLGYKKLLFPRRVLLTCLTAILLSMKTLCGSQSTLQTILSRTCSPYQQGWPLGLQQHILHLWGCGHLAVLAVPELCQQCQGQSPRLRLWASLGHRSWHSAGGRVPVAVCRWPVSPRDTGVQTSLTDRKTSPCTSV